MKLLLIFLIAYCQVTLANIYIRGENINENQFLDSVQQKSGLPLAKWLAQKDVSRSDLEFFLESGEKYLASEMTSAEFLSRINKFNESSVLTSESREVLVDIFIKKNELQGSSSPEIWEQICYFYNLDEKIQLRWPQFYQPCSKNKNLLSLEKPPYLKDDLVLIDGVEWKNKIRFYPRKQSDQLKIQIRIYSNKDSPVILQTNSLSLPPLSRTSLVTGDCHNVTAQLESLSAYELPLPQIFVLSDKGCVDPVFTVVEIDRGNFWQKNKKWLWLSGIIATGIIVQQMNNKEITVEWPW